MSQPKIETFGQILEGDYKNWYIFIQDDSENTGGYLILLSESPIPKDTKGFDVWVESYQELQNCFSEKKWKVDWL